MKKKYSPMFITWALHSRNGKNELSNKVKIRHLQKNSVFDLLKKSKYLNINGLL